ncbi:MAG: restriction endonuclease [Eubacteriales bacterium]|nr:restriction endonuclease [Eubacteriales bacterium]MDD4513495.1 restriction endonuclease [Eubacteriales bacterium]
MQRYLSNTRLSMVIDGVAARVILFAACEIYFFCLYSVSWLSALGGLCVYALFLVFLRLIAKKRLRKREMRMRERLGGELQLERLLLLPRPHHHTELYEWLEKVYPVKLVGLVDDGVLSQYGEELLLIRCVSRHRSLEATAQEVLGAARACRSTGAHRCVLCATCEFSKGAQATAGEVSPPVTLISGKALSAIAGKLFPATDEQLLEIKQRRKGRTDVKTVLKRVFQKQKTG